MDKKGTPMVPKYQVERDKLHRDRMFRHAMIAVCIIVTGFVIMALCMVKQADIFVSGYNARTKDWLNTIRQLQGNTAVMEVTDGYQADP